MDRRLFLTGLFGVAGAAALTAAMPRQAHALATGPLDDTAPGGTLLDELKDGVAEAPTVEGEQSAQRGDGRRGDGRRRHGGRHRGGRRHYHGGHRRGRRRRVRRYRRECYRYRNRWGHWQRRCRRVPFWAWMWI